MEHEKINLQAPKDQNIRRITRFKDLTRWDEGRKKREVIDASINDFQYYYPLMSINNTYFYGKC